MREVTDEDLWLYAGRLEWYVSDGVPSNLSALGDATDRNAIYDLMAPMRGTPEFDRLVRYARLMRTPIEEAERLVAIRAVDGYAELRAEVADGQPDPYGGYRRRLLAYEAYLRNRRNEAQMRQLQEGGE